MNRETYRQIEAHMLFMMRDAAHDRLHIYRVLHQALAIARSHPEADRDILIAACLLHDIGRQAQFEDPSLCHAAEGGKLAYRFLKDLGWEEHRCRHVRDCVTSHRFRAEAPPRTIEAQILYDSDKLDVTGALGIARSLLYCGQVGEPLYTVDEQGRVRDSAEGPDSFVKEYHFKLLKLYDRFCTPEAQALAAKRRQLLETYYASLMEEIRCPDLEQLLDLS